MPWNGWGWSGCCTASRPACPVAIARALLSGPRLLLLDEPVSALDETSRREILGYMERLVGRLAMPTIYVSHSLREVLRLADHMVWLVDGRVRASGAPAEVVRDAGFAAWRSEDAAVLVEAVVRSDDRGDDDLYGLTLLDGPWGPLWTRRLPQPAGAAVRVQIRAADVSLGLDRDERSSILNQFPVQVSALNPGDEGDVLVTLGRPGEAAVLLARVTALSAARLRLGPGAEVFARVKSVAVVD
jgi:molybdate transport system ATP-binding protein